MKYVATIPAWMSIKRALNGNFQQRKVQYNEVNIFSHENQAPESLRHLIQNTQ